MSGVIKWYNAKKGCGVVKTNEQEFFFLRRDIFKPHQHCTYNEVVNFDVIRDNMGVRAVKIRQVM